MQTRLPAAQLISQLISAFAAVPGGWLAYLDILDRVDDEIVRVGAMVLRAKRRLVPYDSWDRFLETSSQGAVRAVAVEFFEEAFEFERAEIAASTSATPVDELQTALFNARLQSDRKAQIDIAGRLFLASGSMEELTAASSLAEQHEGPLEGAAWTARTFALFPENGQAAERLLSLLIEARAADLVESCASVFIANRLGSNVVSLARAALASQRADAKTAN